MDGCTATRRGHGAGRRVISQQTTLAKPRGPGAPGLKNRRPMRWREYDKLYYRADHSVFMQAQGKVERLMNEIERC